jgi:ABC-type transport system involved in cytochrome c biogenesis permease subunit
MVLVFCATLDQVHWGVWYVQKQYFESWFAVYPLNPDAPLHIPMPGGYLLGVLLLFNLLVSHFRYFRAGWKKLGIAIIHAGIVLLLIGGFFTAVLQEESQMEIPTGESRNYTTDFRRHELIFVDKTDAATDRVVSIPDSLILDKQQNVFPIESTDLLVRVRRYWENANIGTIDKNPGHEAVDATQGICARTPLAVFPAALSYSPDSINRGAALVSVETKNASLGSWLVSETLLEAFPPQVFEYSGHTYEIALRLRRHYLPYSLHLEKFTHEYYPGSTVPKNFSSTIKIQNPAEPGERTVAIYMNHPLRYAGRTFYQSQFKSGSGPDITILQVVRNPGRLLPYIAVYMVGAGLLVQFGFSLTRFLKSLGNKKTATPATEPSGSSKTALGKNISTKTSLLFLPLLFLFSFVSPAEADDTAAEVAKLPVQYGGRLQPVDTLARNTLLILRGKQSAAFSEVEAVAFAKKPSTWDDADRRLMAEAGLVLPEDVQALLEKRPVSLQHSRVVVRGVASLDPASWFCEMAFRPKVAAYFRVFRIDNDEVVALLGKNPDGTPYYSWNDLQGALATIDQKSHEAAGKKPGERTPFERGTVKLTNAIQTYRTIGIAFAPGDIPDNLSPAQEYWAWLSGLQQASSEVAQNKSTDGTTRIDPQLQDALQAFIVRYRTLAESGKIGIVPPRTPDELQAGRWVNLGTTLLDVTYNQPLDRPPVVPLYADLYTAWREADAVGEAKAVAGLKAVYESMPTVPHGKLKAETAFNRIEPFYKALCLYVVAFLGVCIGWLLNSRRILTGARWLVVAIFLVHALALFARMWIQGRPPVTNLYSSAVFVAWCAVLLGIIIEFILKDGIGTAAAAIIGFASLIIAHHLAMSGDTLEMMQAVLDDNFWLATHVVTITFGYSAMFVAGLLAVLYLILGIFTKRLRDGSGQNLARAVYGIICFATLLSFVGTMLGGIWADQSWGRFWGWDPKENGALLIVLWCAIFLHARWGKLIGNTGLMQLAIFGNIVTAASWFGTNLLEVGLHSYGFTQSGFIWLCIFWIFQLIFISLGWIPKKLWRSKVTPLGLS